MTKTQRDKKFADLFRQAVEAGKAAAAAHTPTPMVVQQRENPMDDSSHVVQQWTVPQGVCGFAWINIKPGNHPFANWLKRHGHARKDEYYGGVTVWVSEYGQSMELKERYAHGFAEVIRDHFASDPRFHAYAQSRMD